MVEPITNELLLGHLKSVQTRLGRLEEGQGRIERRMSSVEDHLAALIRSHQGSTLDLDQIRQRVERIERRLDLSPAGTD